MMHIYSTPFLQIGRHVYQFKVGKWIIDTVTQKQSGWQLFTCFKSKLNFSKYITSWNNFGLFPRSYKILVVIAHEYSDYEKEWIRKRRKWNEKKNQFNHRKIQNCWKRHSSLDFSQILLNKYLFFYGHKYHNHIMKHILFDSLCLNILSNLKYNVSI